MSELEETCKTLLQYLDAVREAVECATQIEGDFKWERPSLRPIWKDLVSPAGYSGTNHFRYTMKVDVVKPLPPLKPQKTEAA